MSIPLRITQGMMSDRLMSDLRKADRNISKTSNQISSTKRIETAADDPVGAHRALRLRAELTQVDAHRAGTAAADGWMAVTDTALRLAPPLLVSDGEMDEAVAILAGLLAT